MATPNKMVDRADKLVGFEDATAMSGTLQYVGISPVHAALILLSIAGVLVITIRCLSIVNSNVLWRIQNHRRRVQLVRNLTFHSLIPNLTPSRCLAMEMRPGDKAPNPASKDGPPPPASVERTPPDPRYSSGILSVVIHQINNLERQNLKGASGKDREGSVGQDTDEPSEQGNNLPSGYCEILINDDMVYKT